jgi:hypothetical protein
MRYIYLLFAIIFSCLIIVINWKLSSTISTQQETKHDIILQMNFLEDQLKHHKVGMKMQKLFPEGFIFIYALYGLSWCEMAIANANTDTTLHTKAVQEAVYAYDQITSKQAQEMFDPHLFPENGIFYSGWSNYLLSKILLVDTTFAGYSIYKSRFLQQCTNIEEAIQLSKTPYLESYQDQAWPADMMVAVASLRNHDRVFKPTYTATMTTWINRVKENIDPQTHMIPHKVDAITGKSIEASRGGSMALMLRMLAEIDLELASKQYSMFKDNFVSTALTLPCVREYPKGTVGIGDIDSGPVILGVGFPATLVSIGVLPMFADQALAAKQYATVNAFGIELINSDQKYYLFGNLPMADAFITWSRATALSYADENTGNHSELWAWKFHLLSLTCLLLLLALYLRRMLVNLFRTIISHSNNTSV